MKHEQGLWIVKRDCCTSGNCASCRGITPLGTPMRITQSFGLGEAYARWVAGNWASYKAVAEPLPGTQSMNSTAAVGALQPR